jgi:hypothetical protein
VFVDYGEGYEIVFVEEFGYLAVAGFFVGEDEGFLS